MTTLLTVAAFTVAGDVVLTLVGVGVALLVKDWREDGAASVLVPAAIVLAFTGSIFWHAYHLPLRRWPRSST